jgi:hypothetical protein
LDKYVIPVHLGGVGITTFYASEAIAAADPLTYVPSAHQETVSDAFTDWQVNRTSEPVSVYHYTSPGAENPGRWVTLDPNLASAEARSLLALPNSNAATSVTQYVIPAETTYISGGIASQTSTSGFGSYATGGGYQIYIPNPNVLLPVPLLPMP